MLSRVFPVLEKIKVENQFNWGYGDNNGDCGGDNNGEILRNKLEMLMALNWTRPIRRNTITCLVQKL